MTQRQVAPEDAAFPRPASAYERFQREAQSGMTLRDWFAGQAAAGIATNIGIKSIEYGPRAPSDDTLRNVRDIAVTAYLIADALLETRDGQTPQ